MSNKLDEAKDEDAPLVASWRRGDLSALEALVRKHQKLMLNIALRVTGDYDDACEVVQDAFLAAHRNVSSFRGDSRFSTWLTTITINHARNRLQYNKARRSTHTVSLHRDDGSTIVELASPTPSPLELLEREMVQAKVTECIESLPLEFKEAVVLRDMHEYSYEVMAVALNLREGTVKSRIFRGRELVKDCLKKALGRL